ncbi:MAG: hypothetical protein LBR15_09985 [Methanobrevibacter sp.]|jgi:hypothetical protein|nr:hypothetical protein [Candidatus Methanovirga australis]MDR2545410.1 hypothetical protein [Candidatus Methanovirga procula]
MKVNKLLFKSKQQDEVKTFEIGQLLSKKDFSNLTDEIRIVNININTKTGFIEISSDSDNFLWYSLNDIQLLSFTSNNNRI